MRATALSSPVCLFYTSAGCPSSPKRPFRTRGRGTAEERCCPLGRPSTGCARDLDAPLRLPARGWTPTAGGPKAPTSPTGHGTTTKPRRFPCSGARMTVCPFAVTCSLWPVGTAHPSAATFGILPLGRRSEVRRSTRDHRLHSPCTSIERPDGTERVGKLDRMAGRTHALSNARRVALRSDANVPLPYHALAHRLLAASPVHRANGVAPVAITRKRS